jgi:hypothetical protein
MPKAAQSRAASPPMPPTPMINTVASGSGTDLLGPVRLCIRRHNDHLKAHACAPLPLASSPLCLLYHSVAVPARAGIFHLPHRYGTRHNRDRAQGTVNASTRVPLLLVRDPGAERPGVQ